MAEAMPSFLGHAAAATVSSGGGVGPTEISLDTFRPPVTRILVTWGLNGLDRLQMLTAKLAN